MPAAPADWRSSRRPTGAAARTGRADRPDCRPAHADVPTQPAVADATLIAASVRLRVEDPDGRSCGSGTIIDSRGGEALVLTCGHIFRDSHGKGRIEVDLFANPPQADPRPADLLRSGRATWGWWRSARRCP